MIEELLVGVGIILIGTLILAIVKWIWPRARRWLARSFQDPNWIPVFDLELDPPLAGPTNPRLSLACIGGSLTYELQAEIIREYETDFPPIIHIGGDGATQLTAPGEEPAIYRRFALGPIRNGERRSYSLQPNPGVSSLDDYRAQFRLIATATTGGRAKGATWSSTYSLPIVYPPF